MPRGSKPRTELTLRSSRFRISVRKCQFDPEMARSPLVRPAISGLNWQFLPFRPPTGSCSLPFRPSTGTYFGKSKKMEDEALSNTGKARDAGGKPWEFGKTREAVGLKQHKKATAEEIPCKSVSCWKHFGAMLDKRWEVARARGFERIFYARSPQQARCLMARDSLAMIRRLVWPSTSSLPVAWSHPSEKA